MLLKKLNKLKIHSDGRVINPDTGMDLGHYSTARNRYVFKYKNKEYDKAFVIASFFISNPNNYKHIKFKDGDIHNMNSNNLEWTENRVIYDKIEYINKYNHEYILIDTFYKDYDFMSIEEIAKKFRLSDRTIRRKYKEKKLINRRYKISDNYADIPI